MNRRIFLLTDYRDQFYFSTRYRGACADIEKLKSNFKNLGIDVIVKRFADIDLRHENYNGEWILYQSSEDPGLSYKEYIEDIILALELQGAKLIPRFGYFRAHHNKVFMELLRDILPIDDIKSIRSRAFGTYEEYLSSNMSSSGESYVLKPSAGTRSTQVSLLDTPSKKRSYVRKISATFSLANLTLFLSKMRSGKPYTPISNHRSKFVIQNFVSGIGGDYRVLAYGKKFYVVHRKNRKNDFRASGSNRLDFEAPLADGLLAYAQTVYDKFDTPFVSLDIGYKDGVFYLFEFQFLCLGQYTLEKSTFYYKRDDNGNWRREYEKPDLEREIAATVATYIDRR